MALEAKTPLPPEAKELAAVNERLANLEKANTQLIAWINYFKQVVVTTSAPVLS